MKEQTSGTSTAYPHTPAISFIYLGDRQNGQPRKLDRQFQPIFDYLQQTRSRDYLTYYSFSATASRAFAELPEDRQKDIVLLHIHAAEKTFDEASWYDLLKNTRRMPALRLVFLDGFARTEHVQALFSAGVPAVAAMREQLDDPDYLKFLIEFYQTFLKGRNLQEAFDRACWGQREKSEETGAPSSWKIFTQKEIAAQWEMAAGDPEFLLAPGVYLNQGAGQLAKWKLYHQDNQPDDFTFLKPLYPTQTRLHSDRWGEQDLLGYKHYARVIAGIIDDEDSEPPLTIAIIAPWGYGKTTLMHYIRERLLALSDSPEKGSEEKIAGHSQHRQKSPNGKAGYRQIQAWIREGGRHQPGNYHPLQRPIVWFNPWHYQSSEQVWSGMAHAIITQLVGNLPPLEQEEFWFKLQYKRIDFQAIRRDIHKTILTRLVPNLFLLVLAVFALVLAFVMGADFVKIGSILLASGSLIHALWKWYQRRIKNMEEKYEKYLTVPTYESEMGLFHEINEDLSRVFELLVPREPVVVFIDDLDRCSPEKVVEVTEAINLLINGDYRNKCYFVIGMDAQVVAAALDVAYRSMRGRLKDREEAVGSVGWYFLDKFIQLPFIIPSLNTTQKSKYLSHLFDNSAGEGRHPEPAPEASAGDGTQDLSAEDLRGQAKKLLALSQKNEYRKHIEQMRVELKAYEDVIDELILDEALKSNKDSMPILQQLHTYAAFLQPSPRSLKRFANMLRFHTSLQQLKDTKGVAYASTESLAKWLTISLRWPQLVRWIQWEREDAFSAELGEPSASAGKLRVLFLSKPHEKARILDQLINSLPSIEEIKSPDEKDEFYYRKWLPFAIANEKNLPWLRDKELFLILYEKNQPEARLEKALEFNVW